MNNGSKTKQLARGKRRKIIHRAERIFMGRPVRDAGQSLLVQPIRADIDLATKGDPENCAYAQCVKRVLHSSIVFVYHTVAYIEVLDEEGQAVLERYIIKDGTRQYLEDFDDGASVAPAGFRLRAPLRSQTLNYKAKLRRDQARRGLTKIWQDTRYAKLRKERESGRKLARRKVTHSETTGSFRNGTGCVKFIGIDGGKLMKRLA